jgi:hypothetical protein
MAKRQRDEVADASSNLSITQDGIYNNDKLIYKIVDSEKKVEIYITGNIQNISYISQEEINKRIGKNRDVVTEQNVTSSYNSWISIPFTSFVDWINPPAQVNRVGYQVVSNSILFPGSSINMSSNSTTNQTINISITGNVNGDINLENGDAHCYNAIISGSVNITNGDVHVVGSANGDISCKKGDVNTGDMNDNIY